MCSAALTVGLAILLNAMYLWYSCSSCLAGILSSFSLGYMCLYWIRSVQKQFSENEVVVITGCDSGLGYSLALYCRNLGSNVIAGVLKDDGPAVENLKHRGIHVHSLDVTERKSVEDFGAFVRHTLTKNNFALRALVNNAAVMIFGEIEWQNDDQIAQQVNVNILGTMRITRELLPSIRANSSRIVTVTSHCSMEPLPGLSIYSATKSAINAWCTSIRVELKKYGVEVVSFVPGSFPRESNIMARQKEHFEKMKASMTKEAEEFYGDYFTKYTQYLSAISEEKEPKALENREIYNAFRCALLDRYPSVVYKCEPWRYFFYFQLFKISPSSVRDWLVEQFVAMPSWSPKTKRSN